MHRELILLHGEKNFLSLRPNGCYDCFLFYYIIKCKKEEEKLWKRILGNVFVIKNRIGALCNAKKDGLIHFEEKILFSNFNLFSSKIKYENRLLHEKMLKLYVFLSFAGYSRGIRRNREIRSDRFRLCRINSNCWSAWQ